MFVIASYLLYHAIQHYFLVFFINVSGYFAMINKIILQIRLNILILRFTCLYYFYSKLYALFQLLYLYTNKSMCSSSKSTNTSP